MRIGNGNSYNLVNYNFMKNIIEKKSKNNDASSITHMDSVQLSSRAANRGGRELPVVPIDGHQSYNPFTPMTKLTNNDTVDVDKKSNELAQKFIENGFASSSSTSGEKTHNGIKEIAIITEAVKKARIPIQAKEIGQILKDNGINLEQDEELNITVDKKGVITIAGDNAEKAQQIEKILNQQDWLGWKLNRLTNLYSTRYAVDGENKYDPDIFHEMDIENTLRYLFDEKVSLSDLSVENGNIVGLSDELNGLINGTNSDMTEHEKTVYSQIKKVTLSLLQRGIDNVPDLTTDATYKNGILVFN